MDKRLFWLALGSFTISTEGFVISSLLPDIAGDAGISIPLAGTLITAFALAYAIGTPILATLTGEWDRRRVILWTLVFFVIGNHCRRAEFLLRTAADRAHHHGAVVGPVCGDRARHGGGAGR